MRYLATLAVSLLCVGGCSSSTTLLVREYKVDYGGKPIAGATVRHMHAIRNPVVIGGMTEETKTTDKDGIVKFSDSSGLFWVTAPGYSPASFGGSGIGEDAWVELYPLQREGK